jgi:type 2 lantibiotic biosynthesis protein LanM
LLTRPILEVHPMTQTFQDSSWYKALTFNERVAALRESLTPATGEDRHQALRRAERWREQAFAGNESQLDKNLAADGITPDELLSVLGASSEAVKTWSSRPPVWLARLTEAFSGDSWVGRMPLSEQLKAEEMIGLLELVRPLVGEGCERVHAGIQHLLGLHRHLPFDPNTVKELLFRPLPSSLCQMMSRTVVLEMHVARLHDLLQGDTTRQRCQSFVERLRSPDHALDLLLEYPLLARQLANCVDQWAGSSLEFLERLCADWDTIRAELNSADPGVLVQLECGMGDTHRNGRSVAVASFQSGFRLVYKPRSLSLDIHFQRLLAWLNERGDHAAFRALTILDRGKYGWVEFVAAGGCASRDEVERFYERQGGYLALLYCLKAADFHYENLIAAGEHPLLLDLEALFHPILHGFDSNSAEQLAASALRRSVLSTGLPPHRMWANDRSDGVDLSGFGGAPDQMTPFSVAVWEGVGTDEMRLIRKRLEMGGSRNRPTLNGCEVNPLDYAETLSAGFANIYRLLMRHRDELLAPGGPLALFADDEVRVIVRETQTYGALLRESFHPDVMRDGIDRDILFDRLWTQTRYLPELSRLVPHEIADLQRGDIPLFTTRPASTDLWTSSETRIAGFLEEPGLLLATRHIQQLSEDDLSRQRWFLRMSLSTLTVESEHRSFPSYDLTESRADMDRERLLSAACAIGRRLEHLALRGEGDASWIGVTPTVEGHLQVTPLGMDLYDGLPGTALFLAYLGAMTREESHTALARAALNTLRRQANRSRSSMSCIGGFTGWGGIIYTLAHLSALWKEPALYQEAEEIAASLPDLIAGDELSDVIGGAAGCIWSLASLLHCNPSRRTLQLMLQCGERLIDRAVPMECGAGWIPKFGGTVPLAGLSHGAAGIASALFALTGISGDPRFRKAGCAALSYERTLFCRESGNWRDLRDIPNAGKAGPDTKGRFFVAWCHGAPGIGLARLQCLDYVDQPEIRREIDVALQTTLAQGFGHNHSLCHGDLGNVDLLLQASQVLGDRRSVAEVNRLGGIILDSIDQHGWLCGLPFGVESPGLMTGLSGIGYELLRLADPLCVPSILSLAPPPGTPLQTRFRNIPSEAKTRPEESCCVGEEES